MAKQKTVPPTQAQPLNREQRRHPEARSSRPKDERPLHPPLEDMVSAARVPDDLSVRAKSSGHGKKTADKWNQ